VTGEAFHTVAGEVRNVKNASANDRRQELFSLGLEHFPTDFEGRFRRPPP